MGDLIDRQAAIDAVDEALTRVFVEHRDVAEKVINKIPSAQPEQNITQERYEDLCEYFKDCSDQGRSILNDRKEFKSWLDRMKWHVMECNKLGRELEKFKSTQSETHDKRTKTHTCDLISKQAVIDTLHMDTSIIPYKKAREYADATILEIRNRLEKLPSVQPEPLTDKEQRIFLAAMGREEKVCKQVDEECRDCREPYDDSLVWTCREITRKVKGALWI